MNHVATKPCSCIGDVSTAQACADACHLDPRGYSCDLGCPATSVAIECSCVCPALKIRPWCCPPSRAKLGRNCSTPCSAAPDGDRPAFSACHGLWDGKNITEYRQHPLTIGLLGGSVTYGFLAVRPVGAWDLGPYSLHLASTPGVTVIDRSVRAAGSLVPSLCLDPMLAQPVDVLVMEFALNDEASEGAFMMRTYDSSHTSSAYEPLFAVERLLRRVLHERPQTQPIFLYICPPTDRLKLRKRGCEGRYNVLARHYNVQSVSLQDASCPAQPNGTCITSEHMGWDFMHKHPAGPAHVAVAQLIMQAVRRRRWRSQSSRLPRALNPRLVKEESISWQCRLCVRSGCAALQPSPGALRGFRVKGGQEDKAGWAGHSRGDSISFEVPPQSRVMLSMLCSHRGVGIAGVDIVPAVPPSTAPSGGAMPVKTSSLNLTWASRSSQQCFWDVGTTGAQDAHLIRVRVLSEGVEDENLVKIFDVLIDAGTQAGAFSSARWGIDIPPHLGERSIAATALGEEYT